MICKHESCTCEARDGDDYCSDWCNGATSEECHCHHGTCHAPHHH